MAVQKVYHLNSPVQVTSVVNIHAVGAYNNATVYAQGDIVTYNGGSYVALGATVGNLPTNTAYWQVVGEKGDPGAAGATGATGATGPANPSMVIQALGIKDTNYTIDFNSGLFATATTGSGVATLTIPDWDSATESVNAWLYITQGATARQQTIGAASGTNNNVIGSGGYAKALPNSGANLTDAYQFIWTGTKWMIINMLFDVKAIV